MSRKRLIVTGALVVVTIAIVGAAFALRSMPAYAHIATGYAAQQTCACVHVAGRALESCLADFPADAREQITVTVDGDQVRASALGGVFKSEAEFEEGFGCSPID